MGQDLSVVGSAWVLADLLEPFEEHLILILIISDVVPGVRNKLIHLGDATLHLKLVLEIHGFDMVDLTEYFWPPIDFSIREDFTNLLIKILIGQIEFAAGRVFVFALARIEGGARVAAFDLILCTARRSLPVGREQLGFVLFFCLLCHGFRRLLRLELRIGRDKRLGARIFEAGL